MLATSGALPSDPSGWAFEYKWDGVRALCFHDGNVTRLFARSGREITRSYPELQSLGIARGSESVVLDGEIIALDDTDRPSFGKLQTRMHVVRPSEALVRSTPVWFVLFDILYRNGESLISKSYEERREMLLDTTIAGPYWQVTPSTVGEGAAMLAAAGDVGIEGLVAKRLDSQYLPGKRSTSWLKVKIVHRQEFVVGGWVNQAGSDADNRVGSLLVGYNDCHHTLRYAGRVGSGFSNEDHARLVQKLSKLSGRDNPFGERVPLDGVRFVRPKLVVDVEFRRWPSDGLLQHAAFKGIRNDKDASDVVMEHPQTLL